MRREHRIKPLLHKIVKDQFGRYQKSEETTTITIKKHP